MAATRWTTELENAGIKWVRRASLGMAYGGGVILAAMMFLTFFDVFGRSVFNAPIGGSVEMLTQMMGLLIYLGIAQTTVSGGHIRVDIVTELLPVKLRGVLDVIVHVLSFLTVVVICWRLWTQALEQTADLNVTQNLGLPVWLIALLMATSSLMLVVGMLVRLAMAWQSFRRGGG